MICEFTPGEQVWFRVDGILHTGKVVGKELFRQEWSNTNKSMAHFYCDLDNGSVVIQYTVDYVYKGILHTSHFEGFELFKSPSELGASQNEKSVAIKNFRQSRASCVHSTTY